MPNAKLTAEQEVAPEAWRHREKPHLGHLGVVPHDSVAKAHVSMKVLSALSEVRRRERLSTALSLSSAAREARLRSLSVVKSTVGLID